MKWNKLNWKAWYHVLVLLLASLILIESILITNNLTKRNRTTALPAIVPKPIISPERKEGSLALALMPEQTVQVNQDLKVQLSYDSPEEIIDGIEAILTFDPALISVSEITPNKKLFEQIIINNQEEKQGRITITAYMPSKPVKGKDSLADLTIRLLKNQETVLGIEFLGPDRITDSNMVSQLSQKDILDSVQSLTLTPL